MHRNSRGFALVVPLILVLFAVGIAGYFVYQSGLIDIPLTSTKTSTQPTPITNPTAEWEKFIGKEFSFKYPSSWSVTEEYSDYFSGNIITIENHNGIVSIELTPTQQPYGFAGPEAGPESVITKTPFSFVFLNQRYETLENTVGGRALFVDQKVTLGNGKEHFILFGTGYPVNDDQTASLEEYQKEKLTILQILSTFEFTDQDQDSGFECPQQKTIDCTPCTGARCPLSDPQYCHKGTPQYDWIIENCPDVEIINAT